MEITKTNMFNVENWESEDAKKLEEEWSRLEAHLGADDNPPPAELIAVLKQVFHTGWSCGLLHQGERTLEVLRALKAATVK